MRVFVRKHSCDRLCCARLAVLLALPLDLLVSLQSPQEAPHRQFRNNVVDQASGSL